jgi:S1-C subfamily serine protease
MADPLSSTLTARVGPAGTLLVRADRGRRRGATALRLRDDLAIASHRALPGDDDVAITLPDDSPTHAEILGRDPGSDLVVLRLHDAPPVDPLDARDPDTVAVGELVLVVARPGRTLRAALGMIGVAGEATRTPSGTTLDRWLEIDRDLPRGFSGGVVVDLDGRPLGLATRGLAEGAGVVVPGGTLLRVADQIAQHGRVPHGYLGVGVFPARLPKPLRDQLGQRGALAVVGVSDSGPAATAGLQVGDLILQVGGRPVGNPMQLRAELLERSGETLDVRILRGGAAQDLRITAGTRP